MFFRGHVHSQTYTISIWNLLNKYLNLCNDSVTICQEALYSMFGYIAVALHIYIHFVYFGFCVLQFENNF